MLIFIVLYYENNIFVIFSVNCDQSASVELRDCS